MNAKKNAERQQLLAEVKADAALSCDDALAAAIASEAALVEYETVVGAYAGTGSQTTLAYMSVIVAAHHVHDAARDAFYEALRLRLWQNKNHPNDKAA